MTDYAKNEKRETEKAAIKGEEKRKYEVKRMQKERTKERRKIERDRETKKKKKTS